MLRPACATLALLAAQITAGCGTTLATAPESWPAGQTQANTAVTADHRPFEPLLRVAIGDLAQRLNIDPADIGVIEARAVIWPDRSMGCPRPGMSHAQVPQDGAFIRLRAGGREFAYHSGGGRPPFLCDLRR